MNKIVLSLMVLCLSLAVYGQGQITRHAKPVKNTKIKRPITTRTFVNYNIETENVYVNGEILEMVTVEGGTFQMGINYLRNGESDYLSGYPSHKESVSSFKISKYVVTEKLWATVMDDSLKSIRGEKYPVECSWDEAVTFISKLNILTGKQFRLPTEKEWEYAAKGGKYSKGYKYSGGNNINDVGWKNSEDYMPVGQKKANELGLYDMSGNIFEWCDEPGEQPHSKVLKGGAWNFYVEYAIPASRQTAFRGAKYYSGFRLVLDINVQSLQHNQSISMTEKDKTYQRARNYELGLDGCSKSPEQAKYWYEIAISYGSAEAMANMGIWYFYGINVEKDETKGIQYMKRAIDYGYKEGQKYLDEMVTH